MTEALNPFESPAVTDDSAPIDVDPNRADRPRFPFESGHKRATVAISLLAMCFLIDAVATGSGFIEIQLLNRLQAGSSFTDAECESNDIRQRLIGLVQVIVSLASGVTFLLWFHRVHRNLPALGARSLKYSPGWAVGSWFVPILNLFRPYQIMKEVWGGSDPAAVESETGIARVPNPSTILGLWWALWIIVSFINQIAFRLSLRAETLPELLASSWACFVGDVVSLPAALAAILVVRAVDASQTERFECLRELS